MDQVICCASTPHSSPRTEIQLRRIKKDVEEKLFRFDDEGHDGGTCEITRRDFELDNKDIEHESRRYVLS